MKKNILISGASFAGLTAAYWMSRLGYRVTVVEKSKGLKKGGTPVNIKERTIVAVRRMGLFDQILKNSLPMESMEFKNSDDVTERGVSLAKGGVYSREEEYEIERDVLLDILFDAVKDHVEFIWDDSIASLQEENDDVVVTFGKTPARGFELIFGCDGIHSAVRKYHFGEEAKFCHFLKNYFSITIVDRLLIREYTTQIYNEPGKLVMLNAYNKKTDIVLCFSSDRELPYDYRNEAQQRRIILQQFSNVGWRTAELLREVTKAETFYFDKLCQMKMPSWTKGRVALVGDSGYCASPAAGRGGSLAIDGATALADAFQMHDDDFQKAFQEYNASFRPFVEKIQAEAVEFCSEHFVLQTEEAIRKRNSEQP